MKITTLKTIEVIIAPGGAMQIETHGFSGADCQQADHFLRQTLGTAATEALKPEFYATTPVSNTTEQQSG